LTEDLDAFDVISTAADVERLQPRARFGVAAQTTQPIERVRELASLIRCRFPLSEVRVAETTVCVPTRLRQEAAAALASMCDVVVVVGDARSNNTRELGATCRAFCAHVFLVQGAGDLRPEWFAGARVAGLTAGTSTPDAVVDSVDIAMQGIAKRRVA
jgi:4-hydroxy-3-methylbut-2-enyl diphosphate reductase